METVLLFPPKPKCLMTPAIAFKPATPLLLRLNPAAFRLLATAAAPSTSNLVSEIVTVPEPSTSTKSRSNGSTRSSARAKKATLDAGQLKLNWLESLSFPLPENDGNGAPQDPDSCYSDSGWVFGVDPDLSGALAVLKPDNSPQVYDSPNLEVLVGKRLRKRLDVKSIIQLLRSVDAPIGTTVYIEQSIPYPQDGKQIKQYILELQSFYEVTCLLQELVKPIKGFRHHPAIFSGWWSGGFGYGLWIGILVASGYCVVPVPSLLWKKEFKLTGDRSSKDNSRELASTLFPCMSSQLQRKKDHGRAEALLIAAYGKGLKVKTD